MGKAKKTRKFAAVKRMISPNDARLKVNKEKAAKEAASGKGKGKDEQEVRHVEQTPSNLFFQYNTSLGPPYQVLVDTNFINFSIKNKLDVVRSMMDCLLAKCTPCITDCVMAELEKLGTQFRVALRLAKDPRMERLPCTHKGTYADDCLVNRVQQVPWPSGMDVDRARGGACAPCVPPLPDPDPFPRLAHVADNVPCPPPPPPTIIAAAAPLLHCRDLR